MEPVLSCHSNESRSLDFQHFYHITLSVITVGTLLVIYRDLKDNQVPGNRENGKMKMGICAVMANLVCSMCRWTAAQRCYTAPSRKMGASGRHRYHYSCVPVTQLFPVKWTTKCLQPSYVRFQSVESEHAQCRGYC